MATLIGRPRSKVRRWWDDRLTWGWVGFRLRKLTCWLTEHRWEPEYEWAGYDVLIGHFCLRCLKDDPLRAEFRTKGH